MKHLLLITAGGQVQPHWQPGTPWQERLRLARAYRAFIEGVDPRDHQPGWYRFDIAEDGNAWIGGRALPSTAFEILRQLPPFPEAGSMIEILP